jgi:hypothetical protein
MNIKYSQVCKIKKNEEYVYANIKNTLLLLLKLKVCK